MKSSQVKIFRSKGCPTCNFTGFFGRTAIYEILVVDEKIKEAILKKIPSNQIKRIALNQGMQTLRQDGWQKVISGITTPEEVMKVAPAQEEPEKKIYIPKEEVILSESADSRVYPRKDLRLNLRFRVIKSDTDILKNGLNLEQFSVTKNISCGGTLFVFDKAIPLGSILEVKLELPDEKQPIECLARVTRVEEIEENKTYEIAVCFLDLSSQQRARLEKYLGG
jgi:hypothetical protein